MAIRADEKDIVISRLSVQLIILGSELDDMKEANALLLKEVDDLKAQLAKPVKNGAPVG